MSEPASPTIDEAAALRWRVVCGVFASAARFVPVPLLDDLLREKAFQLMVSRALEMHGRTYGSGAVSPLYSDSTGCLHGCVVFAFLLPLKLIVFPIRKIWTIIMTAKHLVTDLNESILLGRVIDRQLASGRLAQDTVDTATLAAEALRVRQAFENAVRGSDMKLLSRIVGSAVASVGGLRKSVMGALRGMRRRGEREDPTDRLSETDKAKLNEGADRVADALADEEARTFLAAFDARFDENLAILEARGLGLLSRRVLRLGRASLVLERGHRGPPAERALERARVDEPEVARDGVHVFDVEDLERACLPNLVHALAKRSAFVVEPAPERALAETEHLRRVAHPDPGAQALLDELIDLPAHRRLNRPHAALEVRDDVRVQVRVARGDRALDDLAGPDDAEEFAAERGPARRVDPEPARRAPNGCPGW